jgi:hypothetical protein
MSFTAAFTFHHRQLNPAVGHSGSTDSGVGEAPVAAARDTMTFTLFSWGSESVGTRLAGTDGFEALITTEQSLKNWQNFLGQDWPSLFWRRQAGLGFSSTLMRRLAL